MISALDADKDGKISTKEIANAVAALRKLDKNKDGKLSQQEIGWPPPPGRGGPGRGGPGRGGPGRGGPGGPRGGGGFFGGFGGGGFGGGGFGGQGGGERPQRPDPDAKPVLRKSFSVKQLRSLDRNKDGKIVSTEVPRLLRKLVFAQADANKDGVIDTKELAKSAGKPKDAEKKDAEKKE